MSVDANWLKESVAMQMAYMKRLLINSHTQLIASFLSRGPSVYCSTKSVFTL